MTPADLSSRLATACHEIRALADDLYAMVKDQNLEYAEARTWMIVAASLRRIAKEAESGKR